MSKLFAILVFAIVQLINACDYQVTQHNIDFEHSTGKVQLQLSYQYPGGLQYAILRNGVTIQKGTSSDNLSANIKSQLITNGVKFSGNGYEVSVSLAVDEPNYSEIKVVRNMVRGQMSRDCFHMEQGTYWYAGPQQKTQQYWPINTQKYTDYSYVTKEADSQAVNERYWLNSKGVFIWVERDVPLFINQSPNVTLCLKAEKKSPYNTDIIPFKFEYRIGVASDAKEAHMKAVEKYLKHPTEVVDERMVRDPIWSTWAEYKAAINNANVRQFLANIKSADHLSYPISQIEIDDMWETCYGSLTVDQNRFPDMKQLVTDIQTDEDRVTVWIHPFVNINCEPSYSEGIKNGYFVTNSTGHIQTQWWNSKTNEAAYIDFTNPLARNWFVNKLEVLKSATDGYGFDGFKFDAGETTWAPRDPQLSGRKELFPELLTTEYIKAVSHFGPITEVRAAQGNQDLAIFMRMIDKDSSWDYNNGLPTLVTTLLQLNMNGYPFVLPDMIGGNGYDTTGPPSQELFLRWLEANVFMPSLQFSYLPWRYETTSPGTNALAKALVDLHVTYAPRIMAAMAQTAANGSPVNPPVWWIAPNDPIALAIGDEFLLGTDILVAPVLEKGKEERRVYIPANTGIWVDGNNPTRTVQVGQWFNHPAPLGTIPFFIKQS